MTLTDAQKQELAEYNRLVEVFVTDLRSKGYKVAYLQREAVLHPENIDFAPVDNHFAVLATWVPLTRGT